jgi:hypothetical protein
MENNLKEIEKVLLGLNLPNNEIVYSIDKDTESKVKYAFLCDTYGKDKTDSIMEKETLSVEDLVDEEKFQPLLAKIKGMI